MGERHGGNPPGRRLATNPLADRRLSLSRREASQRHIEPRRRNCLLKRLAKVTQTQNSMLLQQQRSGALRLVMPGGAGKAQARLVGPRPLAPKEGGGVAAA